MGWALEFPRLIILRNFNVYADKAASGQALDLVISLAASGLSQIVSRLYHAGHILDLILGMGIDMDLITAEKMPWSDHNTLSILLPPCLGGKQIYAVLWRLMDPIGFQNAL